MRQFLPGRINVRLTSGNHGALFSRLNRNNISVFYLNEVDELTVECQIRSQDYKKFQEITSRTGAEIIVLGETGVNRLIKRLTRRWFLLTGILLLLFATLYLPSRILFVQVKGNAAIPADRIIATAEQCGIYFGALRKDVRSEKVKNALISALPELQWVGVNTSGCVAEISVEEKTLPAEENAQSGVSSIIAATDGIIRELTVIRGNPLCRVGQAVKEGQVIISGYTDCGLLLIGQKAEGEVYGETRRKQVMVSPLVYVRRGTTIQKSINFSLQIGKKLINFNNGSGISGTGCVKIYEKEYLTLPGGFQLPVALITETLIDYSATDATPENEQAFDWLSDIGKEYLLDQTVAGQLLAAEEQRTLDNGICRIDGSYTCYEMIGRIQKEESIPKYGSNG